MTIEAAGESMSEVDLTQLEPVSLPVDQLCLDPNNPRLVDKAAAGERVGDTAIPMDDWQAWCESQLRAIGYEDIVQKIQRWGFLPVDRIVVRPLVGQHEKYVVLEGNRRLAAIREIRKSPPHRMRMSGPAIASLEAPQVLVYQGADEEISWLLQGFRHIESIKGWGTYQQARFLVELRDKRGLKPGALAAQAGLDARKVGKLLRSFAGWHQAQADDEYGTLIGEQDFAVFNEAVFQSKASPLAKWLGWDETTSTFQEREHLRQLLGLLKDKTEETGKPRIERVNPDLRDHFQVLLRPEHAALLGQFLAGDTDLGDAYREAERNEGRDEGQTELTDLPTQQARLAELRLRVETLPWMRIAESDLANSFIEVLDSIAMSAQKQVDLLRSQDGQGVDSTPAS